MICSNNWTRPNDFRLPVVIIRSLAQRLIDLANEAVSFVSFANSNSCPSRNTLLPLPIRMAKFWQVWSPMQEKIDRCWFNEKSCQRKGGDRSLAEGKLKRTSALFREGREAAQVCCAYTTTWTLCCTLIQPFPDFPCPPYPCAIGIILCDLLPATVNLIPPAVSSS